MTTLYLTDITWKARTFTSTFYFFTTHNAKPEKNKKSLQATTPVSADIRAYLTPQTYGRKEERTDNTGSRCTTT